jgi:alpha-glucosidase
VELLGRARLPYFDQDEVHDIYRTWRPILDSYPGERMAVAEAWSDSAQRLSRYVGPDELHQVFNFDFLAADWSAQSLRRVIDVALAEAAIVGAPTTWVLSNHDTRRHVTRYGDGELGLRRARAAILLMLALPGVAYVYQGEELGLPEVLDLPDELREDPAFHRTGESRDGCRVPLPWHGDQAPYGFGPDGSTTSWLPAPADWAKFTAARQAGDPSSTLELYRAALRIRRTDPALSGGTLRWLDAPKGVIAFARSADSGAPGAPGLVCVVNVSGASVPLTGYGSGAPVPPAGSGSGALVPLGGYGSAPGAAAGYGVPILVSVPVQATDDALVLPPDTAVYFRPLAEA